MNNDAIGVFDSGVGGLTAVSELNKILPNENIIYFGDTARIPYGSRSRETVLKYANEDIAFLKKHKIKMIIAACGTVSSVIGTNVLVDDMPFTGVLLPAAQAACSNTKNGRIGVIGTPATIRSGSFAKAIKTIRPGTVVVGNPCPLFVHLVENGYTDRDNKITKMVAAEYLAPMKAEGVDTLILGCTHYPIIKDIIADYMGEDVTLISSGKEAAKYAEICLVEKNLLTDRTENGHNTFYVSDSTELFEENAKNFLGTKINGEIFSSNL
ncbi:MAG: glutamate racemase [Ruminococcus sp.]|nr:glutamate racemase [Ruminococcus sp.]